MARKLLILLVIVAVLLWVGSAVTHRLVERPNANSDGVIFAQSYSLSQTINSALVVIADTVQLDGKSHVTQDTALVGRSQVTLNGHIDGDLTAMSSDVQLGQQAVVAGDSALMGGKITLDGRLNGNVLVLGDTLTINRGAQINGDFTACVNHLADERADAPPIESCSVSEATRYDGLRSLQNGRLPLDVLGSSGFSGVGLLFSLSASLALTGLAALAVTLFPRQFSYLTEALRTVPRRMAGLGCLTLLGALGLATAALVVLAAAPVVGLLIMPFGLLGGIFLTAMTLTGWIALALLFGSGIARRLGGKTLPPVVTVILGSGMLFLLWHVLVLLPFGGLIELLAVVLLGTIGLGAAFATRLGTRPLRRSYFVQG